MKTLLTLIRNDWKFAKNECRRTVNKEFTDNEPTEQFKWKLLKSEHSPIRILEFAWSWRDIPYWVHAEWARHKFEKFITSQRDDRVENEIPRGKKPQEAPVTYDGIANMQSLIDAWRKRLCYQATKEARELAEDFKYTLYQEGFKNESNILVPNCLYRCSCPEFEECGFWTMFKNKYKDKADFTNIDERYACYNEWFSENINAKRNKERLNECLQDTTDKN